MLSVGKIIELNELEKRRFLITKKTEGGFGIVYFLKSLSDFPDCVMKIFKNNVLNVKEEEGKIKFQGEFLPIDIF